MALLVAGISLGLSVASFAWRIIDDIYVDAPSVRVELGNKTLVGFEMEPESVFVVTATNHGRRDTTVTNLALVFGQPPSWWWRLLRRETRPRLRDVDARR